MAKLPDKGAAKSSTKKSAPRKSATRKSRIIAGVVILRATASMTATAVFRNGRHPDYTNTEMVLELLGRIAEGESVASVCADDHMPAKGTVFRWVLEGKTKGAPDALKTFSDQYEAALRIKALGWADELQDITDDGSNDWMERRDKDETVGWQVNGEAIQRSRLRADTRKWLLSKVLPKLYGDKLIVGGDEDAPIQHQHEHEHTHKLGGWDEIEKRMAQFMGNG